MAKPKRGKHEAAATVSYNVQIHDNLNLALLFSNHQTVIHTSNEFHLSFFQIHPPPVLPAVAGERTEPLVAVPVAKIVLTPAQMERFIGEISLNLDQFKASKALT